VRDNFVFEWSGKNLIEWRYSQCFTVREWCLLSGIETKSLAINIF